MKFQKTVFPLVLALSLLTGCAAAAPGSANTSGSATTVTAASAAVSVSDGTSITFTDSGVTVSASGGVETEGTAVTVTESGTYLLSGSCADGSVKVKKGTTGVTLVLNGLDLTANGTAPIVCGKSTEVTILVNDGTENTLTDTAENNSETGNADGENAVIKCKDGSQVLLCGTGTLNIQAKGKNGIKSGASIEETGDAFLTIRELTLNIDAPVNDAVNAEAVLNVESGTVTVSAGDDALHCDYTLNIGAEGTEGPTIRIQECSEGLEGAAVNVYSGDISIIAADDCINAANADLTNFSYQLNIFGGTIDARSSTGDGFDSNGDLTISGGTVAVWTANTADNEPLDADGTVTISGGTVLAAGGSSGMGLNLSAQQPCVIFGGDSGMGGQGQQPGQMPGQSSQSGQSTPPEMPTQSGQSTPPEMPTQSGQSTLPEMPSQSGTGTRPGQGGMNGGNSLLTEGGSFTLTASDGTVFYSGSAVYRATFVLFSSDALSDGDSCTLTCGDTQTAGTAATGTVSTGMGGMGGPGGQRSNGTPPTGGFNGQTPGQKPDDSGSAPGQPTTSSGGTAA